MLYVEFAVVFISVGTMIVVRYKAADGVRFVVDTFVIRAGIAECVVNVTFAMALAFALGIIAVI